MLSHVVYVLGAGFSAPLGLPVMSDFLERAKDLYFEQPDDYEYFKDVFETINELAGVLRYFDADLHNIEEILSLLEMDDFAGANPHRDRFIQFLADVVEHYTPPFEPAESELASWKHGNRSFGPGNPGPYANFVAALLGEQVVQQKQNDWVYFRIRGQARDHRYSIVSLNYDLVIEQAVGMISGSIQRGGPPPLTRSAADDSEASVPLMKLHGSVRPLTIVPPTWSKGQRPEVHEEWQRAWTALSSANEVRILGYSLPTTDSNVRYLLKAACNKAPHLKRVDVICRDDGSVKRRYDEFLTFPRYRFSSSDVFDYVQHVTQSKHVFQGSSTDHVLRFDIETAHAKVEWEHP